MDKDTKTKTMETFARHEGDTGSPEVQVALLSNRISELTEHLREHKHDESHLVVDYSRWWGNADDYSPISGATTTSAIWRLQTG